MKADSELAAKRTWRDLYLAALFEPDPASIGEVGKSAGSIGPKVQGGGGC